jgi:hypothetical protein
MEVAAVAVAEDHQLGETLVMIRTQTTIQVLNIVWKWIEKGIALPLVILLHQQDMTASLTCMAGTQIPHAYEHSVNIHVSLKHAITHSEAKSTKQFRTLLTMYTCHLRDVCVSQNCCDRHANALI